MEQGAVKLTGAGRPRLRPYRVVGDKGYTGRRIRSYSDPNWVVNNNHTYKVWEIQIFDDSEKT